MPGPNCFPLHPTAFRHLRPYGKGRYMTRGLTGETALFFSDLRAQGRVLLVAGLPGFRAIQRSSAIRRPNVSFRRRRRFPGATGLRRRTRKPQRESAASPVLNGSTRVELFSLICFSNAGRAAARVRGQMSKVEERHIHHCGSNAVCTSIGVLLSGFGAGPLRYKRIPVKSNVTTYGRKK